MRTITFLFLFSILVTVPSSVVAATEPPVALLEPPIALVDTVPVYDAVGASVVVSWKQYSGCGVCVASEDGKSLVWTCNHIFDDTNSGGRLAPYPLQCTVTVGKKEAPAVAVAGDLNCDFAMVVVDAKLPVAAVADKPPSVGATVWRNGLGTGYQKVKVAPTDPSWVNESCKFFATGPSKSGDSGAGYFNENDELVAIHCGLGAGVARGTPVNSVKVVVKEKSPRTLFPRLRSRLEPRGTTTTVTVPGPQEPPKAQLPKSTPTPVPPTTTTVPPTTYYYLPSSSSSCPGGVCPLPSAPTRRGIFR